LQSPTVHKVSKIAIFLAAKIILAIFKTISVFNNLLMLDS
jgi:hypothetical protein